MNIESLESRTLLSASAINSQVAIDRLEVKADFLKFRADIAANSATLLGDAQTLKNDGLYKDPTLKPFFQALHKDVTGIHQQLLADNLNEKVNVLQDQILIVKEQIQILKDKASGNTAAVTADQALILQDRVKLQDDEIAGLNTRIQTRENDLSELSTAVSNLVTAVEADPSAAAQAAIPDVQKFATDRDNAFTTLTSDLDTLMVARTTLSNALMALET